MPPLTQHPGARRFRALSVGLSASAVLAAGLSGCSVPATADDHSVDLTVFAAASLAVAFENLSADFERNHPSVAVSLNVAGSSQLAAQIIEGAPADVFAAANTATMTAVVDAGLTSSPPEIFATNTLAIAVAPGNPRAISGLNDLASQGLSVVACAPAVPCGAVAAAAASAANITVTLVSEELSVADVLTKVTSGEADAGLVYRTDVAAAEDRVDGVRVPESAASSTTYPIAAMTTSPAGPSAEAAKQWIEFVTGPTGQSELERLGFGTP